MGEISAHDLLTSRGIDRVLELAADRRRRQILSLLSRGEPVTESGLMVRGAGDESNQNITDRHVHLPKLAGAGYIEWDHDTGEIAKGPRFDEVEPLLEFIETHAHELPPNWP